MKTITRLFDTSGRTGVVFQAVVLAAALSVAPVWSAVLIARDGLDEAFRDYGGLLALPVVFLALAARYLVRRAVIRLTGNRSFFKEKRCILELCPALGIAGIVLAAVAAVAVGLRFNLFWFYIIGFFFGGAFFLRVFDED